MLGEFYEGTFIVFCKSCLCFLYNNFIMYSATIFVRVYCGNPWKKILSFLFIQYLIRYKLIAFAEADDRYAS